MEDVYVVGPKKLQKNFWSWRTFLGHEMFLVISFCRKSLAMSKPKADNFMQLFWTFVGMLLWPRCVFFMCQEFEWILY